MGAPGEPEAPANMSGNPLARGLGRDRAMHPPAATATGVARLWRFAQRQGIDRRRFLHVLAAGGATAVLAACGDPRDAATAPATADARGEVTPEPTLAWFKDTTPLIAHEDGKSLEARLENMQELITPVRYFFVRNNSVSLDVDVESWRLSVEGDAITNPIQLNYEAIRKMPSRTLVSYLECAGNHRAMFDLVQGRKAKGTQWKTGGVGNGEWAGVPLGDVLQMAGISDDAVSVLLIGLDTESPEAGFRRVLPVGESRQELARRPRPQRGLPPAEDGVTLGSFTLLPLAWRCRGGAAGKPRRRARQRPGRAGKRLPLRLPTAMEEPCGLVW